jgi:hypothetical protein
MSVDWIWLKASSEREQEADWARRNCVKPARTLPGGQVGRIREPFGQ